MGIATDHKSKYDSPARQARAIDALKALALLTGVVNSAGGWQIAGTGHAGNHFQRVRGMDATMLGKQSTPVARTKLAGDDAAMSRRNMLLSTLVAAPMLAASAANAADKPRTEEELLKELKYVQTRLDEAQKWMDVEDWDRVRTWLKKPPVGYLWNYAPSKNTLKLYADIKYEDGALDTVDQIKAALQLTDQYSYDNVFIPSQPGNGKLMIKEPREQLTLAQNLLNKLLEGAK